MLRMSDEHKEKIWKSLDKRNQQLTDKIERLVNKLFADIFKDLNSQTLNLAKSYKTKAFDSLDVNFWIDYIRTNFRLKFSPLLMQQALFDASISFEGFDLQANNIDLNSPTFTTLLEQAINDSVSNIVESVQTLDKELKVSIGKTLEENLFVSLQEKEELIREDVSKLSKKIRNRSRTIAQTTATKMQSNTKDAIYETMKKKVAVKKVWLSERDGSTRDEHRRADGQEADIQGYFHVGGERLRGPGKGSKPENNINCRCQIIFQKA